jgi:carbamoyl-phosphate synthase large subunit
VVLTFGGQTAIDLAKDLAYADVPIAGLTAEAIEITEDRERFAGLLTELGLEGPRGSLAADERGLRRAIAGLGPAGHRAPLVGHRRSRHRRPARRGRYRPLSRDRRSAGHCASTSSCAGTELDVDAISDGKRWSVPGILEQTDPPGIHSGDSVAVLPPQSLSRPMQERAAEAAGRIALALGVRGILNVQMIAADDRIVVIEANPRASRTVPIVAKATSRDVVAAAVRCALGATLADVGLVAGLADDGPLVAVKAPIGSLWRLPG